MIQTVQKPIHRVHAKAFDSKGALLLSCKPSVSDILLTIENCKTLSIAH